jgi:hypothetical protein
MGVLGVLGLQQRVQFIQNNNTVIQFDVSIREVHKRESPPTRFPIENGINISDGVLIKPFELELTGMISDTPLGGVGQLLTEAATTLVSSLLPPSGVIAGAAGLAAGQALFSALSGSKSPSVAAYLALLSLQQNAQPFDVLTSLYRYPSMWISGITVPRDADTGNAIIFTLTLEQLILVTPQSVNIQIFANPALSANLADQGQQGLGISQAYQNGFSSGSSAVKARLPGGIGGGPT